MGQDETREREEEVNAEPTHAKEVRKHWDCQNAEGVEGDLQVVEQDPSRCQESNAGELANKDVHESSCRILKP
jgi:hypothetical protein